jgi:L-ascorbate metabolism protein UlaG (beta-lactamase superfamily)
MVGILGHIIKLGGKKLLHVGDEDTSIENFADFNLDKEGIDVAFLPDWFLLGSEGQTLIREHIKPRQIVAVHVSRRCWKRSSFSFAKRSRASLKAPVL